MNMIDPISARSGSSGARRALVLVLVLVAWVALGNGTASSSSLKTYTATVTPDEVGAGASATFDVTLANTSTQHTLGSANVSVPSGLKINSVTASPEGIVDGWDETTVRLRDLALPPQPPSGEPFKTTVQVQAAVPCVEGTFTWEVVAKQANSFNGPPGNDFTLEHGNPVLNVVGECALRFVEEDEQGQRRHPTDAEVKAAITSIPIDPNGPGVQVEVIDGLEQRVTSSDALIELAIGADPPPSGATLQGDTSNNAVNGVATFDNIKIAAAGSGYTLVASSPDIAAPDDDDPPFESDAFNIWQQVVPCESDEFCSTSISDQGSMQATVDMEPTAKPATSGALLVSLGADTVDCKDTFNHAPSAVTVDSVGLDGAKTVTLRIDKVVDQQQANNGVSFYEVCFKRPGEPEFLLPACGAADPPCIAAKTKTKAGDVLVTVNLPAGDPIMR